MDEIGGACNTRGSCKEFVNKIVFGNPEGKKLLGRYRLRYDNIKTNL
jgi:hypothetical protein